MSQRNRVAALATVIVLGAGGLFGAFLGQGAQAEGRRPSDPMRSFARALALVEEEYIGPVDRQDLIEGAIQGMLQTLDPHSNYLNKHTYGEMKDEQRGKFYGLGIQITKRGPDLPLTIVAPIDDTPASRAGLQAGDVISAIEGEATLDMTVQDAVRRLKGRKGTPVTITIQRPGEDPEFEVTIVRDEIKTQSVPVAFFIRPGVGYVRISNFTGTTSTELDAAIDDLTDRGMKRLVLDLRSNPGGLLEQAVQVSERFIPPGKLVVYTRGRVPGSDQDYAASKGVERIDVPLVVLVNHSSASASEIVSGAVQDHDRGLVVGETTFGKGLVQRVIPLSDGGALALTTAKYYTPSGRLIQRDYSDLDDYFLDAAVDEETAAPEEDDLENREVRYTDAGRIVYGGGGITPDYIVKSEREPTIVSRLRRENALFDYVVRQRNSRDDESSPLVVDDAFLEGFRSFLVEREFPFDEEAFQEAAPRIRLRLRAQIARLAGGEIEESRVLFEDDPQVLKALTLFEEAAQLARAGQKSREEKERRAELQSPAL